MAPTTAMRRLSTAAIRARRTAPLALRAAQRVSGSRRSEWAMEGGLGHTRRYSAEAAAPSGGMGKRLRILAEVTVSKLFPAGFGWQAASVWADGQGMKDNELAFWLVTGIGDGIAVWIGHTVFYTLASFIYLPDVKVGNEVQTGLWLGSSAVCSGTAWQPIVNVLDGFGMSFTPAAIITTMLCGSCFYFGLRMGRMVYGNGMGMSIPGNNYDNLKSDAQLSLSIGGAAGAFVGTCAEMPGNWLRGVVGVEDFHSDVTGMVRAGTSTALGFACFQGAQALLWPSGRNWTD